jgi:hypothetical protein
MLHTASAKRKTAGAGQWNTLHRFTGFNIPFRLNFCYFTTGHDFALTVFLVKSDRRRRALLNRIEEKFRIGQNDKEQP